MVYKFEDVKQDMQFDFQSIIQIQIQILPQITGHAYKHFNNKEIQNNLNSNLCQVTCENYINSIENSENKVYETDALEILIDDFTIFILQKNIDQTREDINCLTTINSKKKIARSN